jgi:hypothetical protein
MVRPTERNPRADREPPLRAALAHDQRRPVRIPNDGFRVSVKPRSVARLSPSFRGQVERGTLEYVPERLSIVVRASPETNDHEVCLLGDGEDLIERFADEMIGLDPDDILVEPCPLAASETPRAATIGRCDCGVVACGSIEVTIQRRADTVTWTTPLRVEGVCFEAAQYDAEIRRALADLGWETADRTAGRLIARLVDRGALRGHGLSFKWASGRVRQGFMVVSLECEPGPYQLLLHVPWSNEPPAQIASRCVDMLSRDPRRWDQVAWLPQRPNLGPPEIAGPGWTSASTEST